MYNNIIITGANSSYFESLLTLISSIHQYSFDIIDCIIVYDFGLNNAEINKLQTCKKVLVKKIQDKFDIYNNILTTKIKCHFLKMFALHNSLSLSNNILWLDAGVCALSTVESIFNIIDKEHIFLVGDYHLNKNYTHKKCINIMGANIKELDDYQLSSGIIGFNSGGAYTKLIKEAWSYSLVDGCIDGYEDNHRHDQSILSILASRYDCKRYDIDKYGYWTDINRNLNTALKNNSIIFVHRRGYTNFSNIIYEN